MAKEKDEKMYFYDRFAEDFDSKMNMYDSNRRLEVIFDELVNENLKDKRLLDVGSGTGWFSKKAVERGAVVTSLDVGENILAQVAKKCKTERVIADMCNMSFLDETFDFIIATEVIEHTLSPKEAVWGMYRILKKDGILIITVPNKIWHFSVSIANLLKIRPYKGYENWVGWYELKGWLRTAGFEVLEMKGFHVVPFVFPFTYEILRYVDRYGGLIGPLMLNIAVKARKN